MKADFSGYATKAGLTCTDGRTIMPDAFKHQDTLKIPLVWQHGHSDPENVLGHVLLENRKDGVYAYGYFNKSGKAVHTREAVEHGDVTMMSIYANQLIERSKKVIHGVIREVSLVLSGANPGAMIDNITLRHSDGRDDEDLEDEAVIFTGLTIAHGDDVELIEDDEDEDEKPVVKKLLKKAPVVVHDDVDDEDDDDDDDDSITHAADDTVKDVYESMTEEQQNVLHYMVGEALSSAGADSNDNSAEHGNTTEGNTNMAHKNVFEKDEKSVGPAISHDAMTELLTTGIKGRTLKDAVTEYALAHGIEDIDVLFPEARAIADTPEFVSRRMEWVSALLGATRKSPFTRIKTISADLTFDEARAKGYVKGSLKKEEFFGVQKRVTTPTTIYKKQKLDRDDIVDITDFNVVSWLKAEMRLMLDEELARAILIGDGRDISSEDKINEQNIRPIATDNELYTTTINVNIDDANSSVQEIIDQVIMNRHFYKGTGQPTFYTTETWISKFLLLKDTTGRRIYKNLEELAAELRVAAIVPVEVMEDEPTIIGIMVNPVDYIIGADNGGSIAMFDDFDIDYNQYKYLIETRVCGALVKVKSAMVIKKVAGSNVLVAPNMPAFNVNTGVLSITDQTGVVYKNGAGTTINASGSPYAALADGASVVVNATPAAGYYFSTSEDDSWTFTRDIGA